MTSLKQKDIRWYIKLVLEDGERVANAVSAAHEAGSVETVRDILRHYEIPFCPRCLRRFENDLTDKLSTPKQAPEAAEWAVASNYVLAVRDGEICIQCHFDEYVTQTYDVES